MSRITLFADVIVPLSVPNLFTYRVPEEWNELVIPGKRVVVQFGKKKYYTGIIRHVHEIPPRDYQAKYIETIFDDVPVVNSLQLQLWDWVIHYYCAMPGEVMTAALPSGLRLNSETKVVLQEDFSAENHFSFSDKELLIIEKLQQKGPLSIQEISKLIQVANVQPLLKKLVDQRVLQVYEEVQKKYKPKRVVCLRVNPAIKSDNEKLRQVMQSLEKKAFRQLELLLFCISEEKKQAPPSIYFHDNESWLLKSIVLRNGDSTVVNSLVKKNILEEKDFTAGRLSTDETEGELKELNSEQHEAFCAVKEIFKEKEVCLLHGITGSGKTEVYFHLIDKVLKEGKQVLYLVPEIALTTQLIQRIKRCFGKRVGIYHSRFSENERVEIWNGVMTDKMGDASNALKYDLLIGARSAVFLPFVNLGLVIVDEEHDSSFKQQDPSPRYHARDLAIYLASLHKAKTILGSATPSIESYYLASQKKFGLVKLLKRFGEAQLPEILLVDLKEENRQNKKASVFSSVLMDEISLRLSKKEQVILFHNRRGFAPRTECQTCGWIPNCVQCDVSLIYHKHSGKLNCHYCGYTASPPAKCGACGTTDLRYKNYGTERIEEELELIFPDAKIARMDLDSTRSKLSYANLISDFESGEIDILVGTQMVTKGLDFDRVSLVGVIQADQTLSFPDFRAFERGYQLLQQVSGRAGRKEIPGKVIIQTYRLSHPVFDFVTRNDFVGFFHQQIIEREQFHYPPFCRLIEFVFLDRNVEVVNKGAEIFTKLLRDKFGQAVLGPEFPPVSRIRDNFHKKSLLKIPRNSSHREVRTILHQILSEFKSIPEFQRFRININVDPV